MDDSDETPTVPKGTKRRALSSPSLSPAEIADKAVSSAATREKLPIEIADFEEFDEEVRGHLYNITVSQPSKESKARTQAVEEAINCLHHFYKKVTRAYIEVAAKWTELSTLKSVFLKAKDEDNSLHNITDINKNIDDKLVKMKDNIINDIKATVQKELYETVSLSIENVVKSNDMMKENIQSNIKNVVSNEVKEAVHEVQKVVKDSIQSAKPSYASITNKSAPYLKNREITPRNKQSIEFLISPLPEKVKNFKSASEVKRVLKNSVNPVEYDLKVDHLFTVGMSSVKIIANSVDLDKLRNSPKLKEAGLMIRTRQKLRPRLLIKNLPSNISMNDVPKVIAESIGIENPEIKPIVELIRGEKKQKNLIIEVSPEIRKKLLSHGRVYLGYDSCRIEDYISVLQCYKCLKFNHTAKNCTTDSPTCGHCADKHDTRKCENKTKPKCVNCDKLGYDDVIHSALDFRKCPVILKRMEELTRSIDYGDDQP
ncbi:uncharacterized protein LOC143306887 [Osmia lignaria lignaria]|uniref:uncharacterized protein LOC143306887 n=1 Tax=Osmia lignaria lignaria TaxID=1437193 RepID=UPI00402BA730